MNRGKAKGDPRKLGVSAPPDGVQSWSEIDWQQTDRTVEQLQARIAKAAREERWGKMRSLQRILVRSLPARRLAVRRVTTNQGKRTPGIDGVLWTTSRQKMQAVDELKQRRGYQPKPLRRIHIPKRSGGKRPLSIPCMLDRAMQALHLLALEPVAEQKADPNSYGFRKARSIQDAHQRCYDVLARRYSAPWVLDADIKACFDEISHEWLLANIPMDRSLLRKWLKAGTFEGELFQPTEKGTPQGGILSPTLANLTLDGLEAHVLSAVPRPKRPGPNNKVHIIRYADDLVATARTRELLEEFVVPAITAFLAERGLRLSEKKSRIVHIDEGFDFLGANMRKYNGKFLMCPTRDNIKELLRKTRSLIRKHFAAKTENLLYQLNRVLRGWAFQFRHLVASKIFNSLDHRIFDQLWKWACRRHNNKGRRWIKARYFARIGSHNWLLNAKQRCGSRSPRTIVLFHLGSVKIRRHIKVRAEARYHDARYAEYFKERRKLRRRREFWDQQRTAPRQLELSF